MSHVEVVHHQVSNPRVEPSYVAHLDGQTVGSLVVYPREKDWHLFEINTEINGLRAGNALLDAFVARVGPQVPLWSVIIHKGTLRQLQTMGVIDQVRTGKSVVLSQERELMQLPMVQFYRRSRIETEQVVVYGFQDSYNPHRCLVEWMGYTL